MDGTYSEQLSTQFISPMFSVRILYIMDAKTPYAEVI